MKICRITETIEKKDGRAGGDPLSAGTVLKEQSPFPLTQQDFCR